MLRNGFWIGAVAGGVSVAAIASAALLPRVWLPTSARTELARFASAGLDQLEAAFPAARALEPSHEGGPADPIALTDEGLDAPVLSPWLEDEGLGAYSLLATMEPRPTFELPLEVSKSRISLALGDAACDRARDTSERLVVVLASHTIEQVGFRVIRCQWQAGDDPASAWKRFDGIPLPAPSKADLSG